MTLSNKLDLLFKCGLNEFSINKSEDYLDKLRLDILNIVIEYLLEELHNITHNYINSSKLLISTNNTIVNTINNKYLFNNISLLKDNSLILLAKEYGAPDEVL